MRNFVIANLKMNFTQDECKKYLKDVEENMHGVTNKVGIAFPYTHLSLAKDMLLSSKILIGAQNVHEEESGAYTGEISAKMLKEFSCGFVLVGHSERRQNYNETNKAINLKIKRLLKYGMKAVLCVGETKSERDNKKTNTIIKGQIEGALSGLYENELKNVVIAYEPVWAVGTGVLPSTKDVDKVCKHIRDVITQNFSEKAGKGICILYGGSLKPENAKQYFALENVNGGLIGGASLQPENFIKIAKIK